MREHNILEYYINGIDETDEGLWISSGVMIIKARLE